MFNSIRMVSAFAGFLLIAVSAVAAPPKIVNGGFESDFTGWSVIGSRNDIRFDLRRKSPSNAASLRSGDFSYLPGSLDSTIETFLGMKPSSLDEIAKGSDALVGTAMKQTFIANAGDIIKFDWSFGTFEEPRDPFNDFAFVSLNGKAQLLADTYSEDLVPDDRTILGSVRTLPQIFSYRIPTSGAFTIGFGVMQVNDREIASAMLVDNVVVSVPEPTSVVIFMACAVVSVLRRSGRKQKLNELRL